MWKEILYGTGTIAKFSCGSAIAVSHVAGAVAPVSKNVTYGTVTNIPGEPSKCWITSNLGANHQADSANDATEASAGWYWQFNHKQGYKHDFMNRIPNTTWIAGISENSNWISGNDPCTLELGAGWRIPSGTEMFNVMSAGYWYSWIEPWNSALKMHMAGYLHDVNGIIQDRGSLGVFWTATTFDATSAWYYDFGLAIPYINDNKDNGFSLRCLRAL